MNAKYFHELLWCMYKKVKIYSKIKTVVLRIRFRKKVTKTYDTVTINIKYIL